MHRSYPWIEYITILLIRQGHQITGSNQRYLGRNIEPRLMTLLVLLSSIYDDFRLRITLTSRYIPGTN
jgi:hypothetical protein